jgi:hypothetical protein
MRTIYLAQMTLLSVLVLAGCGTGISKDRAYGAESVESGGQLRTTEKYADCMRDARGDVFAERTCEVYLD